jgi:hypothetical protein
LSGRLDPRTLAARLILPIALKVTREPSGVSIGFSGRRRATSTRSWFGDEDLGEADS